MSREFSLYRYPRALWPRLLGSEPFLAEGALPQGGYRTLEASLDRVFGGGDESLVPEVSRFLLEEGTVVALWATGQPQYPGDPELRRGVELRCLCRELGPVPWTDVDGTRHGVGTVVRLFLESLPTPAQRRHRLAEDGIALS